MRRFVTSVMLCFVLAALPLNTYAQAVVKQIHVQGNQRIEEETVISNLEIKQGEAFSQDKINASIKKLFATGFFADVSVSQSGDRLIVKVTENPIINRVTFEGNRRIDDDALKAEVKLRSRSVYTRAKLQQDVERINDIYRKSGRFFVTVEPKVIQLSKNRMDLVFEIDEGPKTKIRKIFFIGNNIFSNRKLEKVINTKESRWYRFFSGNDTYDPDKLAYDREMLRKFYVSKGYADFEVTSATSELTPDKKAFFITIAVNEGEKYTFGKTTIHSSLTDVDSKDLESSLKTHENDVFNAEKVEESIDNLIRDLSDRGYAFVDISPTFKRHPEKRMMDISYEVKEGPRVYVNRINIKGNVRTLDKVVRREFRISEGDPYNAAKIRRSQQRIRNLGFFETVDINNVRTDVNDKVDIDVAVAEKSTGELNFGAGFSTTEGGLANIGIRERNLLGKGQDLRLNLQLAQKGSQIDLGFTEPYFLGRDLSAGFDIFSMTRDRETESSFDSESQGIILRVAYSLTEHLRHSLRYSIRNDKITDIDDLASIFVKRQEGETTTSLVGQTFVYDARDNRFEPTSGYYLRFNQELAGLGGDAKFISHEFRSGYYRPVVREDVILKLLFKAGNITGLDGDDVRINHRFFIGGNEFRGFDTGGIGPRDSVSQDALGGNTYYVGTAELGFPLGLPEELDVKGALFADAGSLTDTDDEGTTIQEEDSIRLSVGAGISWGSPLGPIRIDFARALMKESFDDEETIKFSFGTRF